MDRGSRFIEVDALALSDKLHVKDNSSGWIAHVRSISCHYYFRGRICDTKIRKSDIGIGESSRISDGRT